MDATGIHELTAAYALDALDEHDEREYEEHLRRCPECREQLTSLQETASMLAYGAAPVAPPPALRQRILDEVRADGQKVVPLRRPWIGPVAGAVAAIAAVVAIGLGIWASSLRDSLDEERAASERAADILADPRSEQVALRGAPGRLVVAPSGEGVLVVRLDPAPAEKTYEAWVIEGDTPRPAGLFDASRGREIVPLTRPVPDGATVAVTQEREGGVDTPEGRVIASAQA